MNQVDLPELARRLIWFRQRRGMTQRDLAEGCAKARKQLFRAEWLPKVPQIRRDRIAKIELAANGGRNAARAIWDYEIRLLAAALEIPEPWLRGTADGTVALWDPMLDPLHARAVGELIAFHEKSSRERWSWSKSLPCSLQTPSFFRWHTKYWALSKRTAPCQNPPQVTRNLILVGEANRERTLPLLRAQKLRFFVVMPAETIKSIAHGSDFYGKIPPRRRLECLRWFVQLMEELQETLRVVLLHSIPGWFSSYEDVYVTGGLAAWTDLNGLRFFSESPGLVQRMRKLVQAAFAQAQYHRREDVRAFVRDEADALATALAVGRNKPSTHRPAVSPERRLRTSTVGRVALEKTRTANLEAR